MAFKNKVFDIVSQIIVLYYSLKEHWICQSNMPIAGMIFLLCPSVERKIYLKHIIAEEFK
jgi:hypothetical protein